MHAMEKQVANRLSRPEEVAEFSKQHLINSLSQAVRWLFDCLWFHVLQGLMNAVELTHPIK